MIRPSCALGDDSVSPEPQVWGFSPPILRSASSSCLRGDMALDGRAFVAVALCLGLTYTDAWTSPQGRFRRGGSDLLCLSFPRCRQNTSFRATSLLRLLPASCPRDFLSSARTRHPLPFPEALGVAGLWPGHARKSRTPRPAWRLSRVA